MTFGDSRHSPRMESERKTSIIAQQHSPWGSQLASAWLFVRRRTVRRQPRDNFCAHKRRGCGTYNVTCTRQLQTYTTDQAFCSLYIYVFSARLRTRNPCRNGVTGRGARNSWRNSRIILYIALEQRRHTRYPAQQFRNEFSRKRDRSHAF